MPRRLTGRLRRAGKTQPLWMKGKMWKRKQERIRRKQARMMKRTPGRKAPRAAREMKRRLKKRRSRNAPQGPSGMRTGQRWIP
ncbi:MAG: hypothetical protein HDQ96_01750 [Lachnospiraceae bacterium]|nr:hypothetical protein [Lachnospiraceae bacterium]